jgi:hypothetical protein
MAKKPKSKSTAKSSAQAGTKFDESALTKGELRKLNALRKSVGEALGEKTFSEWLKKRASSKVTPSEDKNAALIADALVKLIDEKKLRIPRGGYHVTRGRGRVIVTRAQGGK